MFYIKLCTVRPLWRCKGVGFDPRPAVLCCVGGVTGLSVSACLCGGDRLIGCYLQLNKFGRSVNLAGGNPAGVLPTRTTPLIGRVNNSAAAAANNANATVAAEPHTPQPTTPAPAPAPAKCQLFMGSGALNSAQIHRFAFSNIAIMEFDMEHRRERVSYVRQQQKQTINDDIAVNRGFGRVFKLNDKGFDCLGSHPSTRSSLRSHV